MGSEFFYFDGYYSPEQYAEEHWGDLTEINLL